jgi:hypothetical protein
MLLLLLWAITVMIIIGVIIILVCILTVLFPVIVIVTAAAAAVVVVVVLLGQTDYLYTDSVCSKLVGYNLKVLHWCKVCHCYLTEMYLFTYSLFNEAVSSSHFSIKTIGHSMKII